MALPPRGSSIPTFTIPAGRKSIPLPGTSAVQPVPNRPTTIVRTMQVDTPPPAKKILPTTGGMKAKPGFTTPKAPAKPAKLQPKSQWATKSTSARSNMISKAAAEKEVVDRHAKTIKVKAAKPSPIVAKQALPKAKLNTGKPAKPAKIKAK